MIVHWPEGIRDVNAFRSMPSHIIDIAPTMLELAGIGADQLDAVAEAPGMSLVPFFSQDKQTGRDPLFFHHENKKALRHGKWKITTIEDGGPWELYDLSVDRGETRNLAEEHPEKLQELVQLWEAQRDQIIQQISQ